MIYVCNLAELEHHARTLRPSHLISLVAPEEQPPTPDPIDGNRHLRVEINDISEPVQGQIMPSEKHVRDLIRFVDGWPAAAPLLVHCVAGISRSTAAALITLTSRALGREEEAARRMRKAAPHAQPNRRMVALADEILGCQGRLIEARETMGPANGVIQGPLVQLPLLG
jgi:predicted protein tyrosine phosphatase